MAGGLLFRIISAYAPTEVTNDEEKKDLFCSELEKAVASNRKYDGALIGTDTNATTEEAKYRSYLGKLGTLPSLNENTNDNGMRLENFVIQNKLCVSSTFFEKNPEASNPEVLKVLRQENSKEVLANFIKQVESVEKLTKDNLAKLIKNVQNETKIKGKNLWLPLRFAITLDTEGPDLNLIVDLFGKERCLHLARSALKF